MSPISRKTLKDWQTEQMQNPEFVAAANELEPGYQIARLRIKRGLSQTQLAKLVGTRQPSIARLENGSSLPSLSFLERVARALDARIELHVLPR
ncbi:MAG TPA: helix-turn-helix transcriptional regulator [Anaerolineales bacterium]|nr:helix-turn-helix transcriptional regulator [Anaerolineales bacterium]